MFGPLTSRSQKKEQRLNVLKDRVASRLWHPLEEHLEYMEQVKQHLHKVSLEWLEYYVYWFCEKEHWQQVMKEKEAECLHFNEVALGKSISTLLLCVLERVKEKEASKSSQDLFKEQTLTHGLAKIVCKVLESPLVSEQEKANFFRVFVQNSIKKNAASVPWVLQIGKEVCPAFRGAAFWVQPKDRPLVFDLFDCMGSSILSVWLVELLPAQELMGLKSSFYQKTMLEMIVSKLEPEGWRFIENHTEAIGKEEENKLLEYVLQSIVGSHCMGDQNKEEHCIFILEKMGQSFGELFRTVNESKWRGLLAPAVWASLEQQILSQFVAAGYGTEPLRL